MWKNLEVAPLMINNLFSNKFKNNEVSDTSVINDYFKGEFLTEVKNWKII